MLKSVFRAVSAAILTSLIIAMPPEAAQAQTEPTLTITDPQLDAPVILRRADLMALPKNSYYSCATKCMRGSAIATALSTWRPACNRQLMGYPRLPMS